MVTDLPPTDKRAPMQISGTCNFVADSYAEIAAMSRRERIEKVTGEGKNQKRMILSLPTLEKLELWMSLNDWQSSPVDKWDFMRLIAEFHNAYINALV